ncbi:formyl transferase [Reticulibacter mediterranei]|uniref:methionyl-tRNA formyltransferase n=1 Tax=Reticulibacter mediterranei TaxID=2778369 RepID=A0A8J3N742_9CHLR|nr:formyltransferase family protein [Reticulibacter mediterranei]GHO96767.1 formyl transferase [Reticulibacter mediterranei]
MMQSAMSNNGSPQRPPRVLFFGMEGAFSFPSLAALLASGVEVCAVIVPAAPRPDHHVVLIQRREAPRVLRSTLPLVNSSLHTSIVQLAWQKRLPVWEISRLGHPETVAVLAAYEPDLICVACFSQRIPQRILTLPHLGCLNIHPSLLPANRGPVPLFWTFREGQTTTGVTIHFMERQMDSGDILAQKSIAVPDGISYNLLERNCASEGGVLLAQSVWDLYTGDVTPRPQIEEGSSYHSFPADEDFVVYVEQWDARHIYNFICGVGEWDEAITLRVGEETLLCRHAISYSFDNLDGEQLYYQSDEGLMIRCKSGWVCVEPLS